MQDEAFAVFAAGVVVEALFFIGRGQGGDGQRLGFAAGENRRAVDPRQSADFAVKRAQIADAAAIGTHAFVHDGNAECFLLQVFEGLFDIEVRGFRRALLDGGLDLVAQGADFLGALGFGRRVDGGFDPVTGDCVGDLQQVVLGEDRGEFALFLAGEADEFFLQGDELGHGDLGEVEGFDELLFGEFVGLAFDHDDVGLVADVDQVEITVFALVVGRVDDELTVHAADAHRADWAGERDV